MTLKRKIALVDLTSQTIEIEPISNDLRERFLGGRGIGAYLAWLHGAKACHPLRSDNLIVVNAGLLGGTLAASDTYGNIISKSPLTGFFACTLLGGPFAAEMRWAGFDHIVIRGKAPKPVYLFISNGSIEIKDATDIWGKSPHETRKAIIQQNKDRETKTCAIGPAGENLVRFATLRVDRYGDVGRTGLGAVFGAKRIKALACRGTGDIQVTFPDQCLTYRPYLIQNPSDIPTTALDPENIIPEEINEIATRQGMDAQTVYTMVLWAARLSGQGVIDRRHTRGLTLDIRDVNSLIDMTENIADRRNLGRLLGEGPLRASAKLGFKHLKLFSPPQELLNIYRCDGISDVHFNEVLTPENPKHWRIDKGPGTVSIELLYNLISDCLGVSQRFEDQQDKKDKKAPFLSDLLRVNTGLNLDIEELLTVAYRIFALERLYNIAAASSLRRQNNITLTLDLSDRHCVTLDKTDPENVDKIRKMTDRFFRETGWGPQDIKKKKVFEVLEISDLWEKKNQ